MVIIAGREFERAMVLKEESLKHTEKWRPNPSIFIKPSTVIKVQHDSMTSKGKQKVVYI